MANMNTSSSVPPYVAFFSGALAGFAVDIAMFPLDTIKTRIQSDVGFVKAGGFRNIYAGLGSTVAASVPSAASFFLTYEFTKQLMSSNLGKSDFSIYAGYTVAAGLGECSACLTRVPMEVVKQRTQAGAYSSSFSAFSDIYKTHGVRAFYRGYFATVFRDIPFAFVQFPLWEFLKNSWVSYSETNELTNTGAIFTGALAGGISAAATTPLDVIKTRIMLGAEGSVFARGNIGGIFTILLRENGIAGLFAGTIPRSLQMSIGGAIFLGLYEITKQQFTAPQV